MIHAKHQRCHFFHLPWRSYMYTELICPGFCIDFYLTFVTCIFSLQFIESSHRIVENIKQNYLTNWLENLLPENCINFLIRRIKILCWIFRVLSMSIGPFMSHCQTLFCMQLLKWCHFDLIIILIVQGRGCVARDDSTSHTFQ